MYIKLASLNEMGFRDQGKAVRQQHDLFSTGIDVAAIQETYFICWVDARVLSSYFVGY